MRIPADFDRYKSGGPAFEIDLNYPMINDIGEPEHIPAAARFAAWLRSQGWTVDTERRGRMRIGGRTLEEDASVRDLAMDLLQEFFRVEESVVY